MINITILKSHFALTIEGSMLGVSQGKSFDYDRNEKKNQINFFVTALSKKKL